MPFSHHSFHTSSSNNIISSDPTSPNYGKHLTVEEVTEMFAPSVESVDTVIEWLKNSRLSNSRITHSNRGWLAFDALAAEIEHLLHTKYHHFKYLASSNVTIACDESVVSQLIR